MDQQTLDLLRLTCVPGMGPVLIARAIETLGSPSAVLNATPGILRNVRGIGETRARGICEAVKGTGEAAERELELAGRQGVRLVGIHSEEYPALLRLIGDPPPLLFVKGGLLAHGADKYPVAIVGSRSCTAYGVEQAGRFAQGLAQAGLTVVSGGARGIDTAAHRAALRVGGRTIAVLGCGLATWYPPDNAGLFEEIAEGRGAVVSELPLRTAPSAENFPARNRIISGLSLGVLVVEAGARSGALITARLCAEEHGREVFALPGRVDSASSEGSLELLKEGGAALVTHPDDILGALESPARHLHVGTHGHRYAAAAAAEEGVGERVCAQEDGVGVRDAALTELQRAIIGVLDEPRTIDEVAVSVGVEASAVRAEITILEIKKRVRRSGTRLVRA